MTVLQRTDLTTSQKIQCAAAAVAGQHAHGSKTALSETYEISRPTVYAVGAAAESVLRSHFEASLLQGAAVDVRVDDAQLRRAVVALRVLAWWWRCVCWRPTPSARLRIWCRCSIPG